MLLIAKMRNLWYHELVADAARDQESFLHANWKLVAEEERDYLFVNQNERGTD